MFIQSVYIMKTLTRRELFIMPIICALRNGPGRSFSGILARRMNILRRTMALNSS